MPRSTASISTLSSPTSDYFATNSPPFPTCPDILPAVNILAHVTSQSFQKDHVTLMHKTVKQAHAFVHCGIAFPSPNPDTLHIGTFSDASFATNDYGPSHCGFIILLVGVARKAAILVFASRKSNQVIRSALGEERIAVDTTSEFSLQLRG